MIGTYQLNKEPNEWKDIIYLPENVKLFNGHVINDLEHFKSGFSSYQIRGPKTICNTPSLTFLPNSSISLALVMYNSRSCDFRSLLFSNSSSAWAMESSNWSGAEAPFFTILACAVTGIYTRRRACEKQKGNQSSTSREKNRQSLLQTGVLLILLSDPSTGERHADAVFHFFFIRSHPTIRRRENGPPKRWPRNTRWTAKNTYLGDDSERANLIQNSWQPSQSPKRASNHDGRAV